MDKTEKTNLNDENPKAEPPPKVDEEKDEKKQKNHNSFHELEHKIKVLEEKLKAETALAEENKVKGAQYLNTASYYKNQAEETKKDFERFKERNKNIEAEAKTKANGNVIKKLLPVIDNFDQAMSSLSPEIMRGFAMIYSSLLSILTEFGAVEIKANGEKLDPEKHNCIDTVETDDKALDGVVAKVYQKGYELSDTGEVLRAATVSVYKLKA